VRRGSGPAGSDGCFHPERRRLGVIEPREPGVNFSSSSARVPGQGWDGGCVQPGGVRPGR
jgi:hypothetical protein